MPSPDASQPMRPNKAANRVPGKASRRFVITPVAGAGYRYSYASE